MNLKDIVDAITTKLAFRGKVLTDVVANFRNKEGRYKALWTNRLSSQMTALPPFDEVYREVQRAMRQAGLTE